VITGNFNQKPFLQHKTSIFHQVPVLELVEHLHVSMVVMVPSDISSFSIFFPTLFFLRVVIAARREERLKKIAKEIKSDGGEPLVVKCGK